MFINVQMFHPIVVQITENCKRKCKLTCVFIHYCYVNIRSRACWTKQLVALILQSCAFKPLQKKRAQQEDIVKRLMENNEEKWWKYGIYVYFLYEFQFTLRSTQIWYFCLQLFFVSSVEARWTSHVTVHQDLFAKSIGFYRYVNFSISAITQNIKLLT